MITKRPFYTTMALPPQPRSCNGNIDTHLGLQSDTVTSRLSIASYNMHGYSQGSHSVRDLILSAKPDVFLLQEHWLTPCNLHKFEDDFPQYLCFAASAMRKCLESGVLYGRPAAYVY